MSLRGACVVVAASVSLTCAAELNFGAPKCSYKGLNVNFSSLCAFPRAFSKMREPRASFNRPIASSKLGFVTIFVVDYSLLRGASEKIESLCWCSGAFKF